MPKGYWYNPNRTSEEARKESLICEGQAHMAVLNQPAFTFLGGKARGGKSIESKRITAVDEYTKLMKERGYTFVSTEEKSKEETK